MRGCAKATPMTSRPCLLHGLDALAHRAHEHALCIRRVGDVVHFGRRPRELGWGPSAGRQSSSSPLEWPT
eukprot:2576303-Pyramimonas_sp.AAC.1